MRQKGKMLTKFRLGYASNLKSSIFKQLFYKKDRNKNLYTQNGMTNLGSNIHLYNKSNFKVVKTPVNILG